MLGNIRNIITAVEQMPSELVLGKVVAVRGLLIEATGLDKSTSIGSRCSIKTRDRKDILAEVIGVNGKNTLLMPFRHTVGIGSGCDVALLNSAQVVYPGISWLGRVIDAFGNPVDGKGPLVKGTQAYHFHNSPPLANLRKRVGQKISMGIRAINTFLSCCVGQRVGIFSGSGVGKSMMLAMITRFAASDIKIIGLIGERGREVQEFIQDYLGKEGLSKSIVIVATSDESALSRRQAAYLTLTLSEYFRDLGMHVLCMMDSITRFAMSLREIGLAAGEPPTTKGYTPSVFSELPKLLERAGPGTAEQGSITGLFSVLVEGDDHNEPISDAVRSIIDGHITLDRNIAARNIYPAIDVMNSVSRMMPRCNSDYENNLVNKAKSLIALYNDMSDMIRIGAYKKGTDPMLDEAIKYHEVLDNFISQKSDQYEDLDSSYRKLATIIDFDESK
ncbi:Flagellum-specific ATP synthase [Alphaproteobacteria bacterium]